MIHHQRWSGMPRNAERRTASRHLALRAVTCLLAGVLSACSFGSKPKAEDSAASIQAITSAHASYVAAINTNKVDVWSSALADDVVYLVPNQQALVGKDAVSAWVRRYLQEVTTKWTKNVQDLQVVGDWAFARYTYTASDSVVIRDPETDGGGTANDSGWGLVVYHRGSDGTWRVSRDAWGSDRPAR